MKTFLSILIAIILLPIAAQAKQQEGQKQYKNSFWSVGLIGERLSYKAGTGYELLGNSGLLSVGYGHMQSRWFIIGSADVITGPFNPNQSDNIEMDYQGTGVNAWWGYSAQVLDLRHPAGGYGFTLGINYVDIAGRNVYEQDDPLIPSYYSQVGLNYNNSVRVTYAALSPGIFFCWMKPSRTYGSSVEQLKTRIEGYLLTIAFKMPIFANYQSSHYLWNLKDEASSLEGYDPNGDQDLYIPAEEWENEKISQSGKLKGFTILVSLQALLGT
ncbi:MAG: hypothetical protein AB8G05_05045 [Oligoflexales bacterium]